jgi:DNA-3-methyladenine glycosylase I
MRDQAALGGEDFSAWLWSFVGGAPLQHEGGPRPTQTPESEAMARALKQRGFTFCGPVIVYAFMQAVGMVNDHDLDCLRHAQTRAMARP